MQKKIEENLIFILFSLILIIRFTTIYYINKVPCMEFDYLLMGEKALSGIKFNVDELTPLTYGIIVKIFNIFTDNITITSRIIFTISTLLISFSIYKICELFYDRKTALYSLILSISIPSLVVSDSHSIYFGTAFMLLSFYLIELHKLNKKLIFFILFLISTVLATAARNEYIFVILGYSLFTYLLDLKKNNYQAIKKILFILLSFFLIIFFQKELIYFISLDKEFAGLFSDVRYSYENWTHNLSFHYLDRFDPTFSNIRAEEIYGSAKENNYSIISVIFSNPLFFFEVVLQNIKDFFKTITYPSLFPFYNFIFLGFYFLKIKSKNELYPFITLSFAAFLLISVQLIYHVEARYLIPVTSIILIFLAKGLNNINTQKSKIFLLVIFIFNLIISLAYVVTYSKLVFC